MEQGKYDEEFAPDAAAYAAFNAAQSVYRGSHDYFPLKATWFTTTESVREGWRKIAEAVLEAATPKEAGQGDGIELLRDALATCGLSVEPAPQKPEPSDADAIKINLQKLALERLTTERDYFKELWASAEESFQVARKELEAALAKAQAAVVDDERQRYIDRCKELANNGEYQWWTRLAEILASAHPPIGSEALRKDGWQTMDTAQQDGPDIIIIDQWGRARTYRWDTVHGYWLDNYGHNVIHRGDKVARWIFPPAALAAEQEAKGDAG